MKLFPLFPIHVIAHDLENYSEYRNKLVRYCYQDQKDSDGVKVSNIGGWQSEHKQIDLLSGVYEEVSKSLTSYLVPQFSQRINVGFPNSKPDIAAWNVLLLNPSDPGWGSSRIIQERLLAQAKARSWTCRIWPSGLALCRKPAISHQN